MVNLSDQPIFKSKIWYFFMVVHSGFSILQYSINLSIWGSVIQYLPDIFDWKNQDTDFLKGLVTSSNIAGAAIGTILSSYFSAKYGKRIVFIFGDIFGIIGSILSLLQLISTFIVARFISGIGVGLLLNLNTLFVIEWTHHRYRGLAGGPMVCFTPFGMIISGVIGLLIPEPQLDGNWRKQVYLFFRYFPTSLFGIIPGVISLVHIFGYFTFIRHNSPLEVLQLERDEEKAILLLNQVYVKKVSEEILESMKAILLSISDSCSQRKPSLLDVLKHRYQRIRLFVGIVGVIIVNFSGYFIISIYMSSILNTDNTESTQKKAMMFFIYSSFADLLSVAAATFYIEKIGRKTLFLIGLISVMTTLVLVGFAAKFDAKQFVPYLFILFKIGFGTTISPIYSVFIAETITEQSYMVVGIAFWGLNVAITQTFPMLANTEVGFEGVFWILAIVIAISFILISLFMRETKGLSMQETAYAYMNESEKRIAKMKVFPKSSFSSNPQSTVSEQETKENEKV